MMYYIFKFKWNSKRTNKNNDGVFSVSITKLAKHTKKYIIYIAVLPIHERSYWKWENT